MDGCVLCLAFTHAWYQCAKRGLDSGEAHLGLLGHKLFELLNGTLLPLALRLHCRRRHLLALRGVM